MPQHARVAPHAPLRRGVRRDGRVRQARLRRRRRPRHAAVAPLHDRRRPVMGPAGRGAGRPRSCARSAARDAALRARRSARSATPARPAATSWRSSAWTPSLLSLLVYTYPAIVAVAAVGLGRERLDARRVLRARVCPRRAGARGRRRRGRARWIRSPPRSGSATGAHLQRLHPRQRRRSPRGSTPRLLSALVCTGAAVTLTLAALVAGELRPGAVSVAGWGWLACIADRVDRDRGGPVLRRPAPRRADARRRSCRPPSRS